MYRWLLMKVNLYLIADYLKDIPFEKHLTADPQICGLTHVSWYTFDLPPDPHTLYLICREHLAEIPPHQEALSFLCIGNVPPAYFVPKVFSGETPPVSQDQFLLFPEDTNGALLLRQIQQIFLFFDDWEKRMYELLCRRGSLMELCEHCLELTDNPLCLASSDLRILAYGEHQNKSAELKMFFEKDIGEYLTDEEIDAFRLDNDYLRGIAARSPCILNNDYFGFRHFYNNIYIDDIYMARMVICEVERPIRPGDYAVLLRICDFFKIALENMDIVLNNHPKNFDRLVNRMLRQESIPDEEMDKTLSEIGWNHFGLYFCGIIESDLDRIMHSYQTLCGQLEKFLKDAMAIPLENRILLIVNLDSASFTKESVRSALSPFIRENLLRVGLSNCFRHFSDLPMFVGQAQDTLHMGLSMDDTIWCYDFDSYALPILLERCGKGHKPEDLCLEKLQTLIDYDKAHNRSYVHTLNVYLRHNMSVAKTMRSLYVQRATLLYQLKRIVEISQLNLQDYQTRLYLMIYFALVSRPLIQSANSADISYIDHDESCAKSRGK